MRNILLVAVCLAGLTGCATANKTANSDTAMLQGKTSEHSITASIKLNYLLFLPQDYRVDSTNRWPFMLFLHGAGERGDQLKLAGKHGPLKYAAKHPDFPFIVVVPQCPEGESWSNDSLLALLDKITGEERVDTSRVYLTGLSMGGYGTWNLATMYPEKFAAIAPICGGGEMLTVLLTRNSKSAAFKSLPIWAFHGGKDDTVPLAESERMVKLMKDNGCQEVKLTVYREAKHDSWTETYNNPVLYDWFLEHHR